MQIIKSKVLLFLLIIIGFLEISQVIEQSIDAVGFLKNPTLEDYVNTDKETRLKALEFINR